MLVPIKIQGLPAYKQPDGWLPARMARLTPDAARSLKKLQVEFAELGACLRLSDCYRDSAMQQKAHQDYLRGRKKAYSPPAGSSMHEAGRAIDIDLAALIHPSSVPAGYICLDENQVRAVFEKYGWTFISNAGNPHLVDTKEAWHIEFRGRFQKVYDRVKLKTGGNRRAAYQAMVRAAIDALSEPEPAPAPAPVVIAKPEPENEQNNPPAPPVVARTPLPPAPKESPIVTAPVAPGIGPHTVPSVFDVRRPPVSAGQVAAQRLARQIVALVLIGVSIVTEHWRVALSITLLLCVISAVILVRRKHENSHHWQKFI